MNKIKILNFFTIFLILFSLNVNSMTDKRKIRVIKYEALDDVGSIIEITRDSGEFKCSHECGSTFKQTSNALRHLKKIHNIKNYKIIYDDGTVKYRQSRSSFDNKQLTLSTTLSSTNKKKRKFTEENEKIVEKIPKINDKDDDSTDSIISNDTTNNNDDDDDSTYNSSLLTPSSPSSLSPSSSSAETSSFKRKSKYGKVNRPGIMTLEAIDNNEYQDSNNKNPNYQKVVTMTRQKLPSGDLTPFECNLCVHRRFGKRKLGICESIRYARYHLQRAHNVSNKEIKEIPFPDLLEDTNDQTTVPAPLFTSTSSSLSSLASSSSFTSSSSSSSDTSSLRNLSLLLTTRNLQNQNIPISSTAPVSLSSSLSIDTVDAVNYIDDEPKDYIVGDIPLTSPSVTLSNSSIEDKDGKEEREIIDAVSDNVIIQNQTPFNIEFTSTKNKRAILAPSMNVILKRDNFTFTLLKPSNRKFRASLNINLIDNKKNHILLKTLKITENESDSDSDIKIFNDNIFTTISLNLKLDSEPKETEILPQQSLTVKKHSSFTIFLKGPNGEIIDTIRFENQSKSIKLIYQFNCELSD